MTELAGKILIYQATDDKAMLELKLIKKTVWLTQAPQNAQATTHSRGFLLNYMRGRTKGK